VTATTTHDNPTWRTNGYWATVTAATAFNNRSVAVPSVIRLGLAADERSC
jgi:4-alpha-glucanotransferase